VEALKIAVTDDTRNNRASALKIAETECVRKNIAGAICCLAQIDEGKGGTIWFAAGACCALLEVFKMSLRLMTRTNMASAIGGLTKIEERR
jgi:hypothetical protein